MKKAQFEDIKWEEIPVLLELIQELAAYEKMETQVQATVELLENALFIQNTARAFFIRAEDQTIGFALYFYHFSTFIGRPSLYLEDIYIRPAYRNKGYGHEAFRHLAAIAREMNCGRMEWSCLNWNKPSIAFYQKLGAIPMEDWTVFRLDETQIKQVSEE